MTENSRSDLLRDYDNEGEFSFRLALHSRSNAMSKDLVHEIGRQLKVAKRESAIDLVLSLNSWLYLQLHSVNRLHILNVDRRPAQRESKTCLNNKVAIVTGAATGVGQAIAIVFAQQGAAIVVDYVGKGAEETLFRIQSVNGLAIRSGASHLHPSYQKPYEESHGSN
jgi:hypothetical protein